MALTEEEKKAVMMKQAAMGCFKIPKWPKVAMCFVESLWDFWLFIFIVVSMSVTEEDGDQCGKTVLTTVAVCLGWRFTGFAFHGTKFFLIMFNQLRPNALAFVDTVLFVFEAAWTIFLIIVFADKGSDCNDDEPLMWWCMLLSIINGVIKIIQAVIYTVMCVLSLTFFASKLLTFKQVGESIGFLGTFIGAHHHDDEEDDKSKSGREEEQKLNESS